MAKAMNMNILIALVAIAVVGVSLRTTEAATTHVVGDTTGWTLPPNATFYTTWASTRTFAVNDTLTFTFVTGVHDVARVRLQEDYTDCDADAEEIISNSGPANIVLNATGMHYYVCTFAGHCSRGQKLAINVVAANSSTPSPPGTTPSPPGTTPATPSPPGTTPTTTTSPPPPPSANSASSAVAKVTLVVMSSIAMFFM